MKTREIPGGTGPAAVARALDDAEARLGAMERMNKTFRQGQILKLIRAQADPHAGRTGARAEGSLGIAATQVTLSRDIRDLGLVKTPRRLPADGAGDGRARVWPRSPANSCKTCAWRRTWWC